MEFFDKRHTVIQRFRYYLTIKQVAQLLKNTKNTKAGKAALHLWKELNTEFGITDGRLYKLKFIDRGLSYLTNEEIMFTAYCDVQNLIETLNTDKHLSYLIKLLKPNMITKYDFSQEKKNTLIFECPAAKLADSWFDDFVAVNGKATVTFNYDYHLAMKSIYKAVKAFYRSFDEIFDSDSLSVLEQIAYKTTKYKNGGYI